MAEMKVVIWTETDVSNKEGWLQAAGDAVGRLEDQFDLEIDTWMGDEHVDIFHRGGPRDRDIVPTNWDDVLKKFTKFAADNWEYGPNDNEYHLLLVDRLSPDPGAGYTKGDVNKGSPFENFAGLKGCKAAVGGVNVATKAYENWIKPYGGHGGKVFKATVMHEILHALSYDVSGDDRPGNDCGASGGDLDHSLGAVYTRDDPQSVSPFLLWYTGGDWFSGNSPPCTTCMDNPDEGCGDVSLELSRCTENYVSDCLEKAFR